MMRQIVLWRRPLNAAQLNAVTGAQDLVRGFHDRKQAVFAKSQPRGLQRYRQDKVSHSRLKSTVLLCRRKKRSLSERPNGEKHLFLR